MIKHPPKYLPVFELKKIIHVWSTPKNHTINVNQIWTLFMKGPHFWHSFHSTLPVYIMFGSKSFRNLPCTKMSFMKIGGNSGGGGWGVKPPHNLIWTVKIIWTVRPLLQKNILYCDTSIHNQMCSWVLISSRYIPRIIYFLHTWARGHANARMATRTKRGILSSRSPVVSL